MKHRIMRCPSRGLMRATVLLLLLSSALLVTPTSLTATAIAGPLPLEECSSTDEIVADLKAYIPTRLEVLEVPGVSVALIRDGAIAWEVGFGVANTRTGEPVTKDSVFEVASLSKPVAAYAALTLVDSGALKLDEPVHLLFEKPWLPRSEWGDQITLRQLLAHTSGLSKRLHPLDKSIAFPPGERYSYSNVGFQYVQVVIEQVSGSPLESVASTAVFGPLAMSSSTFADDPDVISGLVSGHVDYGVGLPALMATLTFCFALVFVLGVAIQRLWKKRVAITWRVLAVFYAVAAVASLPLLAWLYGGFNKWWLLLLIMLALFSVWVPAWTVASRLYIRRYSEEWRSGGRLWLLRILSFVGCLAVFALAANAISGPVPKRPLEAPSAAYSMKTTAGDLARFMIELSDPQHLDPDTAAEMVTPQVEISGSDSEGLGIAIYQGRDDDWLWHLGDNADFRTMMMMCPATGDGLVVLTNGQNGFLLIRDIAWRVLGFHLLVRGE